MQLRKSPKGLLETEDIGCFHGRITHVCPPAGHHHECSPAWLWPCADGFGRLAASLSSCSWPIWLWQARPNASFRTGWNCFCKWQYELAVQNSTLHSFVSIMFLLSIQIWLLLPTDCWTGWVLLTWYRYHCCNGSIKSAAILGHVQTARKPSRQWVLGATLSYKQNRTSTLLPISHQMKDFLHPPVGVRRFSDELQ